MKRIQPLPLLVVSLLLAPASALSTPASDTEERTPSPDARADDGQPEGKSSGEGGLVVGRSKTLPSRAAVQSVWQHYFEGKEQGPLLADVKLCLEIGKEGEDKYECVKEVPTEGIEAGTVVRVWQAYLVPRGGSYDDIVVQALLGDQVRATRDVSLERASIRSRTWKSFRVGRAGTWHFVVKRQGQELARLSVEVR